MVGTSVISIGMRPKTVIVGGTDVIKLKGRAGDQRVQLLNFLEVDGTPKLTHLGVPATE